MVGAAKTHRFYKSMKNNSKNKKRGTPFNFYARLETTGCKKGVPRNFPKLTGLVSEVMPSGRPRFRVRVRRNAKKFITLPCEPNHPEFYEAYLAARVGEKYEAYQPPSCDPVVGLLDLNDLEFKQEVNSLWHSCRGGAKRKGLIFDITRDDICDLLKSQEYKCAGSGMVFNFSTESSSSRRPFAMSVDRINSEDGYHRNNIQITTVIFNLAKADWEDEDFISLCKMVAGRNS